MAWQWDRREDRKEHHLEADPMEHVASEFSHSVVWRQALRRAEVHLRDAHDGKSLAPYQKALGLPHPIFAVRRNRRKKDIENSAVEQIDVL